MISSRILNISRYLKLNLSKSIMARSLSNLPSHNIVNMPALSPTMSSGTIGQWLCKPGDKINPGDSIADIETDKASMAFEAQDEFYIAKLLVESGQEIQVGQPIFVSVEEEGDVASFKDFKLEDIKTTVTSSPETTTSEVKDKPSPTPSAPTPAPSQALASKAPESMEIKKDQVINQPQNIISPSATQQSVNSSVSEHDMLAYKLWSDPVKGPLTKKLSNDQTAYIKKYGRSLHKVSE